MIQVTLDRDTFRQLRGLAEPVEVCDETGSVIGVYAPTVDRQAYAGADSPAAEEELRRSEGEPARPLTEILRDLESRP